MDRTEELEEKIGLRVNSLGPWAHISLNVPTSQFDGIAESVASAAIDDPNSGEAEALADRLAREFAVQLANLEEVASEQTDGGPNRWPGIIMPDRATIEALIALAQDREIEPSQLGVEALRRGIAALWNEPTDTR